MDPMLNPMHPIHPPPYYRPSAKPQDHALVGLGGIFIAVIIDSALATLHCRYELRFLGAVVPAVVGGANTIVALALSVISHPNHANAALQPHQNWALETDWIMPAR